jgi:hypothetical protein
MSGRLHWQVALIPEKSLVNFGYGADWASNPVWVLWRGEKNFAMPGFEPSQLYLLCCTYFPYFEVIFN